MVEVGVGDVCVADHPKYLMTAALGSCVGVAIHDPLLKRGALAHVMLPTPIESGMHANETRFASVALPRMVDEIIRSGSLKRRLVAKIAGGSAMFRGDTSLASIGRRNVEEVKRQLELLGIRLIAEDTGESHARTVEFHLDTGDFMVRSYVYGIRKL